MTRTDALGRPFDVWRICGAPVTSADGSGCTCPPGGASAAAGRAAVRRLAEGLLPEPEAVPE